MRPVELEQLIIDLKSEKPCTSVEAHEDSKVVVVVEETDTRHVFDAEESKLILSRDNGIERLFEALDYPDEVFVELHGLVVDPEIMSKLEAFASTVDEM